MKPFALWLLFFLTLLDAAFLFGRGARRRAKEDRAVDLLKTAFTSLETSFVIHSSGSYWAHSSLGSDSGRIDGTTSFQPPDRYYSKDDSGETVIIGDRAFVKDAETGNAWTTRPAKDLGVRPESFLASLFWMTEDASELKITGHDDQGLIQVQATLNKKDFARMMREAEGSLALAFRNATLRSLTIVYYLSADPYLVQRIHFRLETTHTLIERDETFAYGEALPLPADLPQ